MKKHYRSYDPKQMLLMPPSLYEWLPKDHFAYFLMDLVSELDISSITRSYETSLRGAPPFEPQRMLRILFYAYCNGVYSSRQIARRLQEDVAFRVLSANSQPDFRTICKFRKRHGEAMQSLFLEILRLCALAGLVNCGHVALDGTKLQANASKHKAMSYGRMIEEEKRLQEEISLMLKQAEKQDKTEEGQPVTDVPAELAYRERRLARIREAKAALEAIAREQDGVAVQGSATGSEEPEEEKAEKEPTADGDDEPPKRKGRPRKRQPGVPKAKAQRNFTDSDSRLMMGSDKQFLQGYNGQIAVATESQVILAADLTNQAADAPHTVPMVEQVQENTGQQIENLLADAGYFSAANVTELESRHMNVYIPPKRIKHNEWRQAPTDEPLPATPDVKERMQAKIRTAEGRAAYDRRKTSVEPVFGQIKGARGFRQFHLRGLAGAKAEWLLICSAHNVLKLYRAQKSA